VANKYRGEVDIELAMNEGGVMRKFTMRPDFTAMVEFEERTGQEIALVMNESIKKKSVGFKIAAAGIHGGIVATEGKNAPTFEEIGAAIRRTGLKNVIAPLLQYFANSLTSDADLQAAAKAAEAEASGKGRSAVAGP
jgi:hypothetical protein